MAKRKSTEYDRITEPVCCRVVVIEVVLAPRGEEVNIEAVLDELRCFHAAEVVDDFFVRTDFDDTASVMSQRRMAFVKSRRTTP